MQDDVDILVSVHSRFVDSMLSGNKRVELRRRTPRVVAPTRMWIYDTAPTASVRALAVLRDIKTSPPREIWTEFADSIGIAEAEYDAYVQGSSTVAALIFDHINELRRPVGLKVMRELVRGFHPPQFYTKLQRTSPLLNRLMEEISCECRSCLA